MNKSLRDLQLFPSASLVVGSVAKSNKKDESRKTSNIAKRAAAQRAKRSGSHTMQTVGIYGKDDNLKGELVDGGGGTLYEHDVTDDEGEPPEEDIPKDEDADDEAEEIEDELEEDEEGSLEEEDEEEDEYD
mmetsp:Transcript_33865/g.51943  ORF Transcript_33865/g.51943 Transcript_33865/m.51943 type:complete len:131 (-) Transcript_33865:874-1266(-)